MPKKIMWIQLFDHSFDFFKAFDKLWSSLTIFAIFLLMISYLYYYKMHALAYDKLLKALSTSKMEI